MEIWDVYDWDRQKTGRTLPRGGQLEPGDLRLVVHVCLFNRHNQMLIQQRQTSKEEWPGRWDVTVAGSAKQGDTSRSAAQRELREELGIDIDLSSHRPHYTFHFDRGFDDFFLLDYEADPASLTLQPDEVLQVRWADKEEILTMLAEDRFIPYFPAMIELFFAARHSFGLAED